MPLPSPLRETVFPPGTLLARAVGHLLRLAPETPPGRYEYEGESLYVTVQDYETAPAATKPYEAHARYADVQYVLRGREAVYHAPLDRLTPASPYREPEDIRFYEGADLSPVVLGPGDFALFLPGDAHKPGCLAEAAVPIKKAVAKVLFSASALAVRGRG